MELPTTDCGCTQARPSTGIEWGADTVALWEGGEKVQRSVWTQNVRLTGIEGMLGTSTVWGYMQFINEDEPAQMWSMSEGEHPEIAVPFPPYEVQPVNLPLRLALGRLVSCRGSWRMCLVLCVLNFAVCRDLRRRE